MRGYTKLSREWMRWIDSADDACAQQSPALARGFYQFNENLFRVEPGSQKEIDTRAVGAGACGGIERCQRETRAQDFRRTIHISNINFDLLDSLAELLQEACNSPGAARLARSENIEFDGSIQVQLEFLAVLISGHVRKSRSIIGRTNFLECSGLHGDAYDDSGRPQVGMRRASWLARQGQFAEFRIGTPAGQ